MGSNAGYNAIVPPRSSEHFSALPTGHGVQLPHQLPQVGRGSRSCRVFLLIVPGTSLLVLAALHVVPKRKAAALETYYALLGLGSKK